MLLFFYFFTLNLSKKCALHLASSLNFQYNIHQVNSKIKKMILNLNHNFTKLYQFLYTYNRRKFLDNYEEFNAIQDILFIEYNDFEDLYSYYFKNNISPDLSEYQEILYKFDNFYISPHQSYCLNILKNNYHNYKLRCYRIILGQFYATNFFPDNVFQILNSNEIKSNYVSTKLLMNLYYSITSENEIMNPICDIINKYETLRKNIKEIRIQYEIINKSIDNFISFSDFYKLIKIIKNLIRENQNERIKD